MSGIAVESNAKTFQNPAVQVRVRHGSESRAITALLVRLLIRPTSLSSPRTAGGCAFARLHRRKRERALRGHRAELRRSCRRRFVDRAPRAHVRAPWPAQATAVSTRDRAGSACV